MNRAEFEKLRFAYADGELDELLVAEVEAYLRSSPEARALVEADTMLKESLARGFSRDRLPDGFAQRAFARLEADDSAARQASWSRRIIPLGTITAAAACLALWLALPLGDHHPTPPASSGSNVSLAQLIEGVHYGCVRAGAGHHCADLPRNNLDAIRSQMSEKLGLAVFVPDLSTHGCRFQTANYCGLPGRDGAHLIYAKDRPSLSLSVMTLQAMGDQFPAASETQYRGRSYFTLAARETAIVAWDHRDVTYVLCAPVEQQNLLEMAHPVRLAMAAEGPVRGAGPVIRLAAMGWNPHQRLPMTMPGPR